MYHQDINNQVSHEEQKHNQDMGIFNDLPNDIFTIIASFNLKGTVDYLNDFNDDKKLRSEHIKMSLSANAELLLYSFNKILDDFNKFALDKIINEAKLNEQDSANLQSNINQLIKDNIKDSRIELACAYNLSDLNSINKALSELNQITKEFFDNIEKENKAKTDRIELCNKNIALAAIFTILSFKFIYLTVFTCLIGALLTPLFGPAILNILLAYDIYVMLRQVIYSFHEYRNMNNNENTINAINNMRVTIEQLGWINYVDYFALRRLYLNANEMIINFKIREKANKSFVKLRESVGLKLQEIDFTSSDNTAIRVPILFISKRQQEEHPILDDMTDTINNRMSDIAMGL